MTLSVFIVTRDSAAYIERLLRSIRGLADELVIGVDGRSIDATVDVCRPYADQLFRLAPFGDTIAVTRAWLIEQCHGDWIFNLDDDELLSARLVTALPDLMNDPTTSTYWFRKRWLAWPDGKRWLTGPCWAPDWQPRLFHPGSHGIYTRAEAHSSCEVPGDGRFWPEGCIYHLDHLLRSPLVRLAKAQRYARLGAGNEHWDAYIIPDGFNPPTEPVPADDPPWEGDGRNLRARHAPVREVSLNEMDDALARSREPDSPQPPAAAPTLSPTPDLFRANVVCLDDTRTLAAGQPLWLTLQVRNDSPVPWVRSSPEFPEVRVTCHWLRPDGGMHWFDAGQCQFSCAVLPGHTELVQVGVLPPNEPGRYRLRWELVMENVGWFAQVGPVAPDHEVYVYRGILPLSDLRASTFARLFGVAAVAVDSASLAGSSNARLSQMEADRLARQEVIAALTAQLAESEADRAARLEVIDGLVAACTARLELIDSLTARIAVIDRERSIQGNLINRLIARLRVWSGVRSPVGR